MKDVCLTTNLLYLYGHAKHLGIQQRFEINEENVEESGVQRDGFDFWWGFLLQRQIGREGLSTGYETQ